MTALVLAGRRGPTDVFGGVGGAQHKALLDVAGKPMIARVVSALAAARGVGRIVVCIDDAALVEGIELLQPLIAEGRLSFLPTAASPASSVLACVAAIRAGGVEPSRQAGGDSGGGSGRGAAYRGTVLVTTADHALLTSETVEFFLEGVAGSGRSFVVGVMSASCFRSVYPDMRRTFIPLRDDGYGGTNLFALTRSDAVAVVDFWRRAERYRKQPWKLAGAIGLRALVLFLFRRLDLDGALEHIARTVGVSVGAVLMPNAEASIDVDTPADLEFAVAYLSKRES